MPSPAHVAAVVAYTAAAVATALTFAVLLPDTPLSTAVVAGGLVLVAGVVGHEIVARIRRDRSVAARIAVVRELIEDLKDELAAVGRPPQEDKGPELVQVLAEVKLLQSLVAQLADAIPGEDTGGPGPSNSGAAGSTRSGASRSGPSRPAPAVTVPDALPTARTRPKGKPGPARAPLVEPAEAMPGPEPGQPSVADQVQDDDRAVLAVVRDALKADRVDVFVQPIVSLPQRKTRFYEVFSRIRAPDGSYLKPERYLPIAQAAGLVAAIDDLLLFRSIRLVRETERRQHMIGFFVNISAATFNDERFMGEFSDYLADHEGLGSKLSFEVTQKDVSAGVLGTEAARRLVTLGCKFSVDRVDSFDIDPAALAKQDVRFLKLDAATLLAIANRPGGHDNVIQFKRLIESNPIDVIVERIETEQQLVELLDLSIDYGQGFLFGEPYLSKAAQG